jgi:hypothetical protein
VYAITRSLRTLIDGMLSVVSPVGLVADGGSSTPPLVDVGAGVGVGVGVDLVGLGAEVVVCGSGVAAVSEQPAITASSPASASPVLRMRPR